MSDQSPRPDWLASKRPAVGNTLHVALDTLKDVQSRAVLDSDLAADVASTVAQIEQLLAGEEFAA